ncbi:MAG TPA: FixG Ig-like domain-containing protein, partial [Nitrospirota bacterium]|nr:FixG Ig-like domain-containing protein [Nitrospirota bacterium]
NAYELSLRNTGRSDLEIALSAAGPAGGARVTPDAIMLPRGTDVLRVPVSVTLTYSPGPHTRSVTVTLTARTLRDGNSLSKKAFFPMPGHD